MTARCLQRFSAILRYFSISRYVHTGRPCSGTLHISDIKDEDELYVENQIEDDIVSNQGGVNTENSLQSRTKQNVKKKIDEEYRKFIKSKIIEKKEKKLYGGPKMPNLLTFAARAQIMHLHQDDPLYWTPEMLADSFPATPEVIKEILRTKRRPKDEWEIYKHDQRVYNNWLKLRQAQLAEGGPIDPAYRLLVASEKLGLMVNAAGNRSLPMPDLKRALLTQRELAEQRKPKVAPIFSSLLEEGKGRQLLNTGARKGRELAEGRYEICHGRQSLGRGSHSEGERTKLPKNHVSESDFSNFQCVELLEEISQLAGETDNRSKLTDIEKEKSSCGDSISEGVKRLKDTKRNTRSSIADTSDNYAVLDFPKHEFESKKQMQKNLPNSKTLKFNHKIRDEAVKSVKSMYGKRQKTGYASSSSSNLLDEKDLFGVNEEIISVEKEEEISEALSGGLEDIDILSSDRHVVPGRRFSRRKKVKIEDDC